MNGAAGAQASLYTQAGMATAQQADTLSHRHPAAWRIPCCMASMNLSASLPITCQISSGLSFSRWLGESVSRFDSRVWSIRAFTKMRMGRPRGRRFARTAASLSRPTHRVEMFRLRSDQWLSQRRVRTCRRPKSKRTSRASDAQRRFSIAQSRVP